MPCSSFSKLFNFGGWSNVCDAYDQGIAHVTEPTGADTAGHGSRHRLFGLTWLRGNKFNLTTKPFPCLAKVNGFHSHVILTRFIWSYCTCTIRKVQKVYSICFALLTLVWVLWGSDTSSFNITHSQYDLNSEGNSHRVPCQITHTHTERNATLTVHMLSTVPQVLQSTAKPKNREATTLGPTFQILSDSTLSVLDQ